MPIILSCRFYLNGLTFYLKFDLINDKLILHIISNVLSCQIFQLRAFFSFIFAFEIRKNNLPYPRTFCHTYTCIMKDITDTVNDVCTDCCCYGLYGILLLRPRSACPVQIRTRHHIDVYTDINDIIC